MKKLDSLTKEQEDKLIEYREKWLSIGRSTKPLNKEKTIESIKWFYSFGKKKTPYMWFCDSPKQIQLIINLFKDPEFKKLLGKPLKDDLWSNLWSNLRSNLRSNLESNLESNLWSNLRSNLESNLWSNLESNLESNLWSNLESNLWSNLRSNLRSNLESNLESNLWSNLRSNLRSNLESNLKEQKLEFVYFFSPSLECYWVGTYDFILNELFPQKKDKYKEFNNECIEFYKNVYHIVPFEDICFISERPNSLLLNQNGQLDSLKRPSIVFNDTYEIYNINGNSFSKDDWEKKPEVIQARGKEMICELMGVEE